MEEAVADLIDSPDLSSSIYRNREHPIISHNHKKIVDWLNLLQIKKEIAYFPEVWNSHPIIVCRDVMHFESHRMGEGVLMLILSSSNLLLWSLFTYIPLRVKVVRYRELR
jgi:hypothetical protein